MVDASRAFRFVRREARPDGSWSGRRDSGCPPVGDIGRDSGAVSQSRGGDTCEYAGQIRTGTLPTKARLDAVHVAIAAVNGMDYLLTWNLRHLANAAIRGKIEEVCRKAGIRPPIICTPEELMEA